MTLSTSCLPTYKIRTTQSDNGAKQLIARHIESVGGREALLSLKSISRIGLIEFFNDPKTGPRGKFRYRTDIIYPHRLREEIVKKSILIDRGTDGSNYWEWTGTEYKKINVQNQQASMNKTAEQANRDILWLADDIQNLKVAQRAPFWAGNDSCLEGDKDDSIVFVCFDQKTGLLSAKGTNEEYRLFSDWKRSKSIMIPYRLTHFQQSKMVYEVTLQNVKVDQIIDPKRFEIPTNK